MKLVTAHIIRVVYETLIQLPPMDRWRLPPSKDVEFKARALKGVYGLYEADPHVITISTLKVGHLDTLVKTVAHDPQRVVHAAGPLLPEGREGAAEREHRLVAGVGGVQLQGRARADHRHRAPHDGP